MAKQNVSAAQSARNTLVSTSVILCGLALTSLILPSDGAGDVFTVGAFGVGLSLSLATLVEARGGRYSQLDPSRYYNSLGAVRADIFGVPFPATRC